MVHDHAPGRLHDLAVHENRYALVAPAGISVDQTPVVPAEPFVVGGVDVGVVAVAERDQADVVALGQNGFGAVVAAGHAGDFAQLAGPPGVIGATRQDRLARPHQATPKLRVADGVHAVVTTRSGHDFLPSFLMITGRQGDTARPSIAPCDVLHKVNTQLMCVNRKRPKIFTYSSHGA